MRRLILAAASLTLVGCGGIKVDQLVPVGGCAVAGPRKLVILFDGTANSETSHTNIAKLHSMMSLQNRCDVRTYYVEGVGTAGKLLGGFTGWGIGERVRMAYRWLGENYSAPRHDSVFVFGFSRGAYAARIFAALTYSAGVPDLRYVPEPLRKDFVEYIYDEYKGEMSLGDRYRTGHAAVGDIPSSDVDISFMGLFDTVEALGVWRPLRSRFWHRASENVVGVNRNYGDQLCNVKHAAHAMSLDDNRAFIFTPVLLTRNNLVNECRAGPVIIDDVVNEVWFAGAHSDVGGQKGTELDDVPLNWMLGEMRPFNLLRPDSVYSDTFDPVKNPRVGVAKALYYGAFRAIDRYIDSTSYNGGRLKVHDSVLLRLDSIPRDWWQSNWPTFKPYAACFKTHGETAILYRFEGGPECRVERVFTAPQRRP